MLAAPGPAPRMPAPPPWRNSSNAFKTWRAMVRQLREGQRTESGADGAGTCGVGGPARVFRPGDAATTVRRRAGVGRHRAPSASGQRSPAGTTASSCSRPIRAASCGSRAKSRPIFAGSSIRSTRPRPPISNVAGSPTTGSPETFLIRRARLGIEATMVKYYEFRLLPDFAGTSVSKSITDAYMNVHYWERVPIRSGQVQAAVQLRTTDPGPLRADDGTLDDGPTRAAAGRRGHDPRPNACSTAASIIRPPFPTATPTTAPSTTTTTRTSTVASSFVPSTLRMACQVLRGLQFGLSGGVGVENEPLSTKSSTPPTITTPATVTWFAYNTGVTANGVRHRISPEVAYFYHSLGFASQYYQQDQMFNARPPMPRSWTCPSTAITCWRPISSRESSGTSTASRSSRSVPSILARRWLRRGPGNWCSALTGWRSADRPSTARAGQQYGHGEPVEPRGRRADHGPQLVPEQVGPRHSSTGNTPSSPARCRSETSSTRSPRRTRSSRGARSSFRV